MRPTKFMIDDEYDLVYREDLAAEICRVYDRIDKVHGALEYLREDVDQQLRVVDGVAQAGYERGYAIADSFNEYARSVIHGLNRLFKEKFEAGEYEISDEEFDKIISAEEYRLLPW